MGRPASVRVACVTTSRADYGLLRWPMQALQQAPDFTLLVIAAGCHLAPSQGRTVAELEQDGFSPDDTVELLLDTASDHGIATSVGLATIGFSRAFERLRPDWVMLLGDRFEILGAATAALIHRIPICHLCGGDVTLFAYDEAIRHAVSKMAHLHCVTNAPARSRLLQMGEEEWRVVNTGSPGLDALGHIPKYSRDEVFARIGMTAGPVNLLVTHHPVTLAEDSGLSEIDALLSALAAVEGASILFTGVNPDSGSDILSRRIHDFASSHPKANVVKSLGQTLYLNAMREMDAVVGNSSSGLYEAPSLGVPTVNIGGRQEGRLRAASVIDCPADAAAIGAAIETALNMPKRKVTNPYGSGNSSIKIIDALRMASRRGENILHKRFIERAAGQERNGRNNGQ